MKTTYYISIFALSLIVLSACKKDHDDTGLEFAPQMYVSKPYEPYTQVKKHPINPMGLNVRQPAKGTIARRRFDTRFVVADSAGMVSEQNNIMVYDNIAADDYETAARLLKNPYPHTDKVIQEGQVLYSRYCYPCHGEAGDGKGPVAEQYKGVANLKGSAYTSLPEGHIFHVITNGKGRMWPHGSQLNPDERWKVVHYVFELQGRNVPKDIEFKAVKGETFTLDHVLFQSGSATLLPESRRELTRLIAFLQENPSVKGKISGHASSEGAAEDNMKLSKDRAKMVADYLTEHGIGADRVSHEGFGDTQPKASNDTEEGKAQNRRIEFQII